MENVLQTLFERADFMPHITCYLGKPGLIWTMFFTDMMIGTAYVGIALTLWALVRKINIPFNFVVFCFGIFIAACGATHFMEVWTLWRPDYWFSAGVKGVTAVASVASVGTGIYLYRLRHPIYMVAEAAKLSEQRRLDLEALTTDLEQRVAQRTEELERAVKVRDEFISIASHELKTPITSMGMQLQMVERIKQRAGAIGPETSEKAFAILSRQLMKLTAQIEQMLDVSRLEKGGLDLQVAEFNLSELVSEVVREYSFGSEQAGGKIHLQAERGVMVKLDLFRIERLVGNLLSNAIKYGDGKDIDVGLSKLGSDKALLTVRDRGIGIAPELRERIFEKFERAVSASNISGLGLGLFIVKTIVDLHGGTIKVEEAQPKGTIFSVELPVAVDVLN